MKKKNDPTTNNQDQHQKTELHPFVNIAILSFAGGALLGASTFLLIPESLYLLNKHFGYDNVGDADADHHHHENEISPNAIWRVGAALLGGYLLPNVIHLLFPGHNSGSIATTTAVHGGHSEDQYTKEQVINDNANQPNKESSIESGTPVESSKSIDYSLLLSVILGDCLCNFCDGIFVGAALALCDKSTAYTIIGITLYHEIPQELADFFLLTKCVGLTPFMALTINFGTGLTVVLGGVMVLALDISDATIGLALSVASGFYLYLATAECIARSAKIAETRAQGFMSMVLFAVGVILLALTLLNHSHCDGGHDHDHDHDHDH